MRRVQAGYVYEAAGSFYVRYWDNEILADGNSQRVQRSSLPSLLLKADHKGEYDPKGGPWTKDAKGEPYSLRKMCGKRVLSAKLRILLDGFMAQENARQANGKPHDNSSRSTCRETAHEVIHDACAQLQGTLETPSQRTLW